MNKDKILEELRKDSKKNIQEFKYTRWLKKLKNTDKEKILKDSLDARFEKLNNMNKEKRIEQQRTVIENSRKAIQTYESMDFDNGDMVVGIHDGKKIKGRVLCFGSNKEGIVSVNVDEGDGNWSTENINALALKKYTTDEKVNCHCCHCCH